MYVCTCNGITERQVKAAVDQGAKNWADVHALCGREPQCGSCGFEMSKIINPAHEEDTPSLSQPTFLKV